MPSLCWAFVAATTGGGNSRRDIAIYTRQPRGQSSTPWRAQRAPRAKSSKPTYRECVLHRRCHSWSCYTAFDTCGARCGCTAAQGRQPCAPSSTHWQATVCGRGEDCRDGRAMYMFSQTTPSLEMLCVKGHQKLGRDSAWYPSMCAQQPTVAGKAMPKKGAALHDRMAHHSQARPPS